MLAVDSDSSLGVTELYNPIINLTTNELMEKFNLAFYEAQNVSKHDLVHTFKHENRRENRAAQNCTFNQNIVNNQTSPLKQESSEMYLEENSNEKFNDDDLIDYLISEDSTLSPTECDINFDFNDFVEDFDNNVNKSAFNNVTKVENFDTSENSNDNSNWSQKSDQFLNFYVAPPIQCVPNYPFDDLYPKSPVVEGIYQNLTHTTKQSSQLDFDKQKSHHQKPYPNVDLDDLDFEVLSNVDSWNNDLEERTRDFDSGALPPVGTITKNNVDFNNYVRTIPSDDCGYFKQDLNNKSEFGHLLSTPGGNVRNILNDTPPPTPSCESAVDQTFFASQNNVEQSKINQPNGFVEDNQMVLTQTEALLNDDPLLSSSSILFMNQGDIVAEIYDCDYDGTDDCDSEEQVSSSTNFQCRWDRCYQQYESQKSLVRHIEKCHVELKRGDEFTCFWENCPRKVKPFNARYKLLIHMRVHSGEKPNKCLFKGCNKAFSRLENLKIHQRSHTGERPYLCQFSGCSKCFSNSSDRAKHQRTHFDTKPYACQVRGCLKKYTDPSSLRKHVKNHTYEEQLQIKRGKTTNDTNDSLMSSPLVRQFLDPAKQKAQRTHENFYSEIDHSYSNSYYLTPNKNYECSNVKQDLKNKIQKNRLKKMIF